MEHSVLYAIAVVVVFGIGAQWIAWILRIPSILLLLLIGFAVGATGLLDPAAVFGDLLMPVVSMAVALILYEGGLSLRFAELRGVAGVVWALVTVGAVATWGLAAAGAYLILGMSLPMSVLLGAILVVTGPTVVGPLVRHIRPRGPVGSILKWEGIVIDPVGAMLAVLVFEVILVGSLDEGTKVVVMGLLRTVTFGGVLGVGGGLLLAVMLRQFWVPDFLENAMSFMLVVAVYTAAEWLQSESGLLATTVMGVTLANQKLADVRHIVEFKENLRVLLISALFIVLASRVTISFDDLSWRDLGFLAALVLVARPACVLVSTLRSSLGMRERAFLAWVAPRGVVAAAVSSVFALRLEEAGFQGDVQSLVSRTFLVIVGTVVLYGLTAPAVARRLGIAEPAPQGLLIVGAHAWAQAVATALKPRGIRVLLVDTNRGQIQRARLAGLDTWYGSILGEHALDEIDLAGVGRLIAATPNDWVNTLAAQRFARIFGRGEVYQLPPTGAASGPRGHDAHRHMQGRRLFDEAATWQALDARMRRGATVKSTSITEEFTLESFGEHYGERAVPLFVISESGKLQVITEDQELAAKQGDTVISLVEEEKAE